jgi:hypothetical protein
MKIESFLLCWNEIDIMPLVIRHYQKFCHKITIMDNHSTDGSAELAKSLGCEVIPFGGQLFDDQANMDVKNNCWRDSDADFVICCDMDEILFSPRWLNHKCELPDKLKSISDYDKSTIFGTIGWQIMSDEMPKEDLLEITNGFEFKNYAKSIIFNPKAIREINYGPGAHECNPVGVVNWSPEYFYVLHYKHIGGVQRTIDRYKQYQPRMSNNNRKNGWGIHYNRTPASIRHEWNERMRISRPLI